MGEDENSGSFVVKDRRRFDSEGNERTPDKGEAQSPPKAVVPNENNSNSKGASPVKEDTTNNHYNDGDITFSSFVMSLATQALMQLGEINPPPGVQIEVDKVAAKQTIDILSLLENKTKGNLDGEETHLIEGILHNLRLSFVKASK